jgi:hypothetical protein
MPVLELSRGDVPPARARALVFEDPLSRELLRLIERLAPTQATVLITGETGVGKEIVACHVHDLSPRADAPFVAVNCGALALSLVDSEPFRYRHVARGRERLGPIEHEDEATQARPHTPLSRERAHGHFLPTTLGGPSVTLVNLPVASSIVARSSSGPPRAQVSTKRP